MKKYKEQFVKRMKYLAYAVIALVAIMAFVTDWQVASGISMALVVTVGSITLEGKDAEVYEALKGTIETEVNKYTKGYISEVKMLEVVAQKIQDSAIDITTVKEFAELKTALEAMGLTIKSMQEQGKPKYKSITDQIKEQIEARKDEFNKYKSRQLQSFDIQIKVAAEMGLGNMGAGVMSDFGYIEPGITMPMRHNPTLLDLFNGSTDRESFSYVQMVNNDGDAVVQADGTIAPLIDFDLAKATSTAHDAVARVDISEDTIDDIPQMATIINNELQYKINVITESTILATIINASSAFALTTIDVLSPNNLDAIRAQCTQIEDSGFGMPDTVVLRPIDWMNLISAKDDNAGYAMLPMVTYNGTVIDNLKVYKSTAITVGNSLVFDSKKLNFLNYKPFSAQLGYIANNFGEFVATIRGKRRFHNFVKTNNAGAFCYDSFADIKTAIALT